jgi:hypothetical protein
MFLADPHVISMKTVFGGSAAFAFAWGGFDRVVISITLANGFFREMFQMACIVLLLSVTKTLYADSQNFVEIILIVI